MRCFKNIANIVNKYTIIEAHVDGFCVGLYNLACGKRAHTTTSQKKLDSVPVSETCGVGRTCIFSCGVFAGLSTIAGYVLGPANRRW